MPNRNQFQRSIPYIVGVCLTLLSSVLLIRSPSGEGQQLHWVILAGGLLLLFWSGLQLVRLDYRKKTESLVQLGCVALEPAEETQICGFVESLFDTECQVRVLASRSVSPTITCYFTEVTETVAMGIGEEPAQYRTSTLCLFDQFSTAHPDFQLLPRSGAVNAAISRLLPSEQAVGGFDGWYDTDDAPEWISQELMTYLGSHSIWAKSTPWSIIGHGGRILLYRSGITYRSDMYSRLLQETQELGEFLRDSYASSAEEPINPANATVSPIEEPTASIRKDHSQIVETQTQQERMARLLNQEVPRQLEDHWLRVTRPRFGLFAASVVGCLLLIGFVPTALSDSVEKLFHRDISPQAILVICLAGAVVIVGVEWKLMIAGRLHDRKLLSSGMIAEGTVVRFVQSGSRIQNQTAIRIDVRYTIDDRDHHAAYRLFVDDLQTGLIARFAESGREITVLADPHRPKRIVLPQWLNLQT